MRNRKADESLFGNAAGAANLNVREFPKLHETVERASAKAQKGDRLGNRQQTILDERLGVAESIADFSFASFLIRLKHSWTTSNCRAFSASSIDHEAIRTYTVAMAEDAKRMSEAAALLGRMGGKIGGPKGGRARAKKLSAERRREIARKAAQARWAKDAKKRGREE